MRERADTNGGLYSRAGTETGFVRPKGRDCRVPFCETSASSVDNIDL